MNQNSVLIYYNRRASDKQVKAIICDGYMKTPNPNDFDGEYIRMG